MELFLKWFDLLADADEDTMHGIAEKKAAKEDQTLEIIGVE